MEKLFAELHLGESRHDQLRRELRAKRVVQTETKGSGSIHTRFDKRQISERFDRKQISFSDKKKVTQPHALASIKRAGTVKGGKGWSILRQNTIGRPQNVGSAMANARQSDSVRGDGQISHVAV